MADAHGWSCRFVSSGAEAIPLVQKSAVHVAAIDVHLGPGSMDGHELVRAVRALPSSVPLLLYTGADWTEAERVRAFGDGADAVMSCPIGALAEFFALLAALVRRESGRMLAAPVQVEGLVLDPDHGEIRVNGEPRELTPGQRTLLLVLAARSPRVATYAELSRATATRERPRRRR